MFEFQKDQHDQATERTIKMSGAAPDRWCPWFLPSLNKEWTVPSIAANALKIKFQNHFTHAHAHICFS